MCGIAGLYGDFKSHDIKIKKMTDALSHRGPDAEGFFFDHNRGVALGHRRLSIIDLSADANQPFFSKNQRYVTVFNGEIYNFKEIAQELDVELLTNSDTEVLIEAYAKWGDQFVDRLNGMFAIAIYDKHSGKLTLFRDRIGIKPLFYFYDGSKFAFASETKALISLVGVQSINPQALKDYFFLEYIPNGQSIYQHVNKLKAGHKLTFSNNSLEIKSYYDILDKLNDHSPTSDYIELLSGSLGESINRRKISDVPIGAFLSGGADSSLICAAFQKDNSDPIRSFNIGFENAKFDESEYAHKVAEHLHTNHLTVKAKESESLNMLDDVISFYDEPFASTSTFPTMLVCQKAKEHVTVALSGDGGDELFMGYGYYQWHDRFNKTNKLGGYLARKALASTLRLMDNRSKRAADVFDYKDQESAWLHVWSQEQYMFSQADVSSLFGEKYANESLMEDWTKINSMKCHPYQKISLLDLKHYLPDNLLYKVDIASMRSSLEVRVPFLDHQFVENSINIPVEQKVNEGVQKYVQKKVLEKYLPKDLIYRQKWGFPAPISDWLQNEMKFLLEKTLNKKVINRQGIFNFESIQGLKNKYLGGQEFHYKRIWSLISFQLWYQKYVDKDILD